MNVKGVFVMNRLIEDHFVRRLSQFLLLSFALSGSALALLFDLTIIGIYFGQLNGSDFPVNNFLQSLSVSAKSELSTFFAPLLSAFPVVLAAVCFRIDFADHQRRASDVLNLVGHILIVILLMGILFSVLSLVITVNLQKTIDDLVPKSAQSMKIIFTALLSFQAMYIVQLLGLRPK